MQVSLNNCCNHTVKYYLNLIRIGCTRLMNKYCLFWICVKIFEFKSNIIDWIVICLWSCKSTSFVYFRDNVRIIYSKKPEIYIYSYNLITFDQIYIFSDYRIHKISIQFYHIFSHHQCLSELNCITWIFVECHINRSGFDFFRKQIFFIEK